MIGKNVCLYEGYSLLLCDFQWWKTAHVWSSKQTVMLLACFTEEEPGISKREGRENEVMVWKDSLLIEIQAYFRIWMIWVLQRISGFVEQQLLCWNIEKLLIFWGFQHDNAPAHASTKKNGQFKCILCALGSGRLGLQTLFWLRSYGIFLAEKSTPTINSLLELQLFWSVYLFVRIPFVTMWSTFSWNPCTVVVSILW